MSLKSTTEFLVTEENFYHAYYFEYTKVREMI